jgi:hypothetical protein
LHTYNSEQFLPDLLQKSTATASQKKATREKLAARPAPWPTSFQQPHKIIEKLQNQQEQTARLSQTESLPAWLTGEFGGRSSNLNDWDDW